MLPFPGIVYLFHSFSSLSCRSSAGAVCDSPGATNDYTAYSCSSLASLTEALQGQYHLVGDNAYVLTTHLMTPFKSIAAGDVFRDSFNFHLSQLRIRIEMAFGRLVTRWGLLWGPLRASLPHNTAAIQAMLRLHNYCIERGLPMEGFVEPGMPSIDPVTGALTDSRFHTARDAGRRASATEAEQRRNNIVAFLQQNNITRPQ